MDSTDTPSQNIILGIPSENHSQERMVSLVPQNITTLKQIGIEVVVEHNAGMRSGFSDEHYIEAGATIATNRSEIFKSAHIIAQVRGPSKNSESGQKDIVNLRNDHIIMGFLQPQFSLKEIKQIADKGSTSIAMELIPRIPKAQNMDALSSLANLSGYKAV